MEFYPKTGNAMQCANITELSVYIGIGLLLCQLPMADITA